MHEEQDDTRVDGQPVGDGRPTAASLSLIRDLGRRLERGRSEWNRHPDGPLAVSEWVFWTDYLAMALIGRQIVLDAPEAPEKLSVPIRKWLASELEGAKSVDAAALLAFVASEIRTEECRVCDGLGFVPCDLCAGKGGDECTCDACGHTHSIDCYACDDQGGFDCEACGGNDDPKPARLGEWVVNRALLAKALRVVAPIGSITVQKVKGGPLRLRPDDGSWLVFLAPMRNTVAATVTFDDQGTWPKRKQAVASSQQGSDGGL